MNCCHGYEELFNERLASKELAQYRAKGPDITTRMLIDALKKEGVQGLNLLDIGGGVGAIQYQLIAAGVNQATDVDASHAYIHAAREEANRRGIADRVRYQHGNFVELAPQIPPADIVTLDRVVCCFRNMEDLVGLSAARARKLYGLVYPRDTWWIRLGVKVLNLIYRMQRNPFRTFVHSAKAVDAIVRGHGFQPRFYQTTPVWQVVVYSRTQS